MATAVHKMRVHGDGTVTDREHSASSAWRGVLLFGLLAAGCVWLFFASWQSLAGRWVQWTFGYDHGWLIAALSVWLVWREREVLAAGRPAWAGLVLVAGAAFGWLLARAADVSLGQEVMLPVLLWTAALTVFGSAAARALAFPLAFLYFAVPIWDFLNPLLRAATTMVSGALLDLTGVPALIEGNLVTIPAGRFEIAAGCAGVAFFMTAGALAALYGHLHYDGRWARRALLLAVAMAGAMVLNWVRVYVVILAGHLTDMQHYLVRVDHYNFGWVLFVVALVPFYAFARRLEPAAIAGAPPAPPATPAAPSARIAAAVAALAVMALAPLAWHRAEQGDAPLFAVTGDSPLWQKGDAPLLWKPEYVGADAEHGASYRKGATTVDLWVVQYATQSQGKELVYYANHIAAPDAWLVEATQPAAGADPARDTRLVDRAGDRRLVRWWYEVGGRRSASDLTAKLHQVLARLAGRPAAALVAFSAACAGEDCTAAAAALDEFEREVATPLAAALRDAQSQRPDTTLDGGATQ
jgi:exosortase A